MQVFTQLRLLVKITVLNFRLRPKLTSPYAHQTSTSASLHCFKMH